MWPHQAINVVEHPDFRKFALYGRKELTERDLPHRTKLLELIFKEYEQEHRKQVNHFKEALGRISFTSDCWSDPNLTSYMAITAHYMVHDENGRLALRSSLLAFRIIDGKHDGKNLGRIMFEILKEADLLGQVRVFIVLHGHCLHTLL